MDDISQYGHPYGDAGENMPFANLRFALESAKSTAVIPEVDTDKSLLDFLKSNVNGKLLEVKSQGKCCFFFCPVPDILYYIFCYCLILNLMQINVPENTVFIPCIFGAKLTVKDLNCLFFDNQMTLECPSLILLVLLQGRNQKMLRAHLHMRMTTRH